MQRFYEVETKTPLRIEYVGWPTTFPSFYRKANVPGRIITATIDWQMRTTFKKNYKKDKLRTPNEEVDDVEQLRHRLIKEIFRHEGIHTGFEVHSIGDVPSDGMGLGGRGAYTVGFLNAINRYWENYTTEAQLARDGSDIALSLSALEAAERTGNGVEYAQTTRADHYAVAFGGLNQIEFLGDDRTVIVTRIGASSEGQQKLENWTALYDTHHKRDAAPVLADQSAASGTNIDVLTGLSNLVPEGTRALRREDIIQFGEIVDAGWKIQKQVLPTVTLEEFEDTRKIATSQGHALAGKFVGAGRGGFALFLRPPSEAREFDELMATRGCTKRNSELYPYGSMVSMERLLRDASRVT